MKERSESGVLTCESLTIYSACIAFSAAIFASSSMILSLSSLNLAFISAVFEQFIFSTKEKTKTSEFMYKQKDTFMQLKLVNIFINNMIPSCSFSLISVGGACICWGVIGGACWLKC